MQQRELVSGFSELKDLLIRTYKINRRREFVRLYFSIANNELLMHDYDDHKKALSLCSDIEQKKIREGLMSKSHRLAKESLKHPSPAEFLNNESKLYGFFRS